MNKEIAVIKSIMPTLVKNFAKFFELDVTIKLFGVKVFSFHFPPQDDVKPSNVE